MENSENHKVVIVDDSEMDTRLLMHQIKLYKQTVDVKNYNNPFVALQELKELIVNGDVTNFPKLIFLDLQMPGMDGFNFLDLFSKFPGKQIGNCKIIITTSSDEYLDIKKSAAYPNVVDFIMKPIYNIDLFMSKFF